MDLLYYNPFDKFCRSCDGAVVEQSEITIRIKLLRTRLTSVRLVRIYDATNQTEKTPMTWVGFERGYDIYQITFSTDDYKGLIWYYFELTDKFNLIRYYGENSGADCLFEGIPAAFQLTVYDKAIKTPDWYCEGVTYHIFVDRFHRSESSQELINDPDFLVHTNRDEIPEYLPDYKGEILNRDIYGGNIQGIIDKLDYLEELGVKTLYLSPIFEAWSNHKYNTADYMKVDSHFGDEEDLKKLCECAKKRGMHVILDGVFNHTGSDSVYFNQNGRYPSVGAIQSYDSPYRNWYSFDNSKLGYQSWWGINTLPAVNESDKSYQDFIMGDNDSVAEHWLNCGISGWRLDVADELPDEFLLKFHEKVRKCKDDAIVIGEVWEDASNKVAYDVRRKYFTDAILDGVMNYPVKEGILDFLNYRIPAEYYKRTMDILLDHYPKMIHKCLMNLIGTHDTMRAINALACPELSAQSRDFKAYYTMDTEKRSYGIRRLKMAACLQFMFPGSPSVYYGDETAMEGFEDPFNRRCYPWNNQDTDVIEHYRALGKLKRNNSAMHNGSFDIVYAQDDIICILREDEKNAVFCIVNRGSKDCEAAFPFAGTWKEIFTGNVSRQKTNGELIDVLPESFTVWTMKK